MLISTPVSLGELLDKISILMIKKDKITDEKKLLLIKEELSFLTQTLEKNITKVKVKNFLEELIEINSKLWVIEDDIRELERKKQFDNTFIELARSVYITNDERSQLKLKINKDFGSKIVEVKSYEGY